MANLNVSKFISTGFGVGTELVTGLGDTAREASKFTTNSAKIFTASSDVVLAEVESFKAVRAIELETDTKATMLVAGLRLEAIEEIAKDASKKKALKEAEYEKILESLSDR